jgi:hypothetical protein
MRYDTPGVTYDAGFRFDESDVPSISHMKKIKLGFNKKNAVELASQGVSIKTAMTGNANFLTPNPSLAAVGTATTDLSGAITARDNSFEAAKAATVTLHAKIAAYKLIMTQLAAYAENVTAGDAVKLESGGFELRATPEPIGQLPQVEDLKLTINGFPGRLHARWKALKGAASYDVQISATPATESSWTNVAGSSKSFTTVEELTSGTRMYVRVRGIGKSPAGPWSEPIGKIVP